MFTGIIQDLGRVERIVVNGSNKTFRVASDLASEVNVDDSIAHNGVCLTVIDKGQDWYDVVAIKETLQITTLDLWNTNKVVNLELAMKLGDRLDGHMVQGHVDTTATCISIQEESGSWLLTFEFEKKHAQYLISKGSITIDGISLTVVNPTMTTFSVAIIPYTYAHTNLQHLTVGAHVNLEFDLFAKYFERYQSIFS